MEARRLVLKNANLEAPHAVGGQVEQPAESLAFGDAEIVRRQDSYVGATLMSVLKSFVDKYQPGSHDEAHDEIDMVIGRVAQAPDEFELESSVLAVKELR